MELTVKAAVSEDGRLLLTVRHGETRVDCVCCPDGSQRCDPPICPPSPEFHELRSFQADYQLTVDNGVIVGISKRGAGQCMQPKLPQQKA